MRRFEEWTVAYRKRQADDLLIDNQQKEFKTIKNTWRFWCADPHLLEYAGRTYVFAELYDRVLRRGVIGRCELSDDGHTPWKVVLKMRWHLSYPHVFVYGDNVYMIPESYAGNEIAVYKAASFPDRWEKVKILKANCVAVDSTMFFANNQYWLQSLEFEKDGSVFNLYAMENGELSRTPYAIKQDDDNVRPAGNLFVYKGELIRPAQDCSESYGCALNFYQITSFSNESYTEVLRKKVYPSSIRTDLSAKPQGIHTYNVSENYEVIDLKEYKIDWWFYVMRPIWFVWRRVKKLLRE